MEWDKSNTKYLQVTELFGFREKVQGKISRGKMWKEKKRVEFVWKGKNAKLFDLYKVTTKEYVCELT
jgi:hypothetical protein